MNSVMATSMAMGVLMIVPILVCLEANVTLVQPELDSAPTVKETMVVTNAKPVLVAFTMRVVPCNAPNLV